MEAHTFVWGMKIPVIVIDPGHGGRDSGAVGNGLIEKAVNWDMANRVKGKLVGYEVEVVIVQPGATHVSTTSEELYGPPAEANRIKADYFLSLHLNAGGGNGFESFVLKPGTVADAIRVTIHGEVRDYLKGFGIRDREEKEWKYKNLAVLRLTDMPAALLEFAFIDNAREAALLKDEKFLNGLANATAWGIVQGLGLKRREGN